MSFDYVSVEVSATGLAPSCNRILYEYWAIAYLIEVLLAPHTLIFSALTVPEFAALTRIEEAWHLVR